MAGLKPRSYGDLGIGERDMNDELRRLEEEDLRSRRELEEAHREHGWKVTASAKTEEPVQEKISIEEASRITELLGQKERAHREALGRLQEYDARRSSR